MPVHTLVPCHLSQQGPQLAPPRHWARAWLVLVLLAVVLVQSLALLHRVAHAGGPGAHETHQAHEHHDACAHDPASSDPAHRNWLAHLFAGHEETDPSCQLFDALSAEHGAWSVLPTWLVMAVPNYWLNFYAGQALARWAALYQARGPPLSR
jgi:hypothetical protein